MKFSVRVNNDLRFEELLAAPSLSWPGLAVRRALEAGADRVDFGTPHGVTDDEGVALLGTAVLPLLTGRD